MATKSVSAEDEMRSFCESVGELILWSSAIDGQLTKAVIRTQRLSETPMLEPIVAELGARVKVEVLRAWAKHIKAKDWSKGISTWADKVEKVNTYRNMAAHYQVAESDGKLILHSSEARKLLKSIKGLKPSPPKNADDISRWVKAAKSAYERGQKVLANLDAMNSCSSINHSVSSRG